MPRLPGIREAAQRWQRLVAELPAARCDEGLLQTEAAPQMGTSQSVVAQLESGILDMRLSTLERYAHAVGRELVLRLGTGAGSDRD